MEYLSVCDVSDKIGVHEKTIRRYINNGELQAKKIGGQWKINEEWLEDFLRQDHPPEAEEDYCVFMDSENAEGFKTPVCLILDFNTEEEANKKEMQYKSKAYDIMMEYKKEVRISRQKKGKIHRVILWLEEEMLEKLI